MIPYKIKRPKGYNYFNALKEHLNNDLGQIFNGKLIYPRQLDIHLPADKKRPCNFNCYFCQGKLLDRTLGSWELDGLELINELKGRIPYMIYGGLYSEPMMNPYLMTFLATTKKYGSYFGIHTNGSLLKTLEENQGWLTEMCRISNSPKDYLSISLDSGTPESHCRTKGLTKNHFDDIIEGIRMAVNIRGDKDYPSIRVCYLINQFNSSEWEIKKIVGIMKEIGVDSLRFSIPYDIYGKDFEKVKEYKKNVEVPQWQEKEKMLKSIVSTKKPFIFYISPFYQDVERMNFKQCIYGYFEITLAADGNVYKCSSMGSPTFKGLKLGKIPNNLRDFKKMIMVNHDPNFNPQVCFKQGGHCTRAALEINKEWQKRNNKTKYA